MDTDFCTLHLAAHEKRSQKRSSESRSPVAEQQRVQVHSQFCPQYTRALPGSECEDVLRAYCLSLKENRIKIVDLGGKYQISISKSQLSNGLMLFHLFYDMQLGIVLCYRARLPFR